MGQVLQDMTKEYRAVNTRNWASASRKYYHCNVPPAAAFSQFRSQMLRLPQKRRLNQR